MLPAMSEENVAGVGLIGQCWNCPAMAAKLCDGSRFESYIPSATELKALTVQYSPPREKIHLELIEEGYIHPLPECRLNEYACLINVTAYQQNVFPKGDILPLGGNWHGTDWGTIWFHEMYNRGYKFVNFPFEPNMVHAPFSNNGSGHVADSDLDLDRQTEQQAQEYLLKNSSISEDIPLSVSMEQRQIGANRFIGKILRKVKSTLSFS
jgi:hypothetical protein